MKVEHEALLCGLLVGALIGIVATVSFNAAKSDGLLTRFGIEKTQHKYKEDSPDVLAAKFFIKQRIGRPSYSRLIQTRCLDDVVGMITGDTQTWSDDFCATSYRHLVYFYNNPSEDPQKIFYVNGVVDES